MVDEFHAVLLMEKQRTNSSPCIESTSTHSIYTPHGKVIAVPEVGGLHHHDERQQAA
jgi:hypothetical protein